MFAKNIMMVQPKQFFVNLETYEDNKFMHESKQTHEQTTQLALKEFNGLVSSYSNAGVGVEVFTNKHDQCVDSIFPNNWVSFHKGSRFPSGLVVIYKMKHPTRQMEVDMDMVKAIQQKYSYETVIDMNEIYRNTPLENQTLEGTGSLIFDEQNDKVYASISQRCDADILNDFILNVLNTHATVPYELFTFQAKNKGSVIYHTNVMLSILKNHAVVCLETLPLETALELESKLSNPSENKYPLKLVKVSLAEMEKFACNVICVASREGAYCVSMSQNAYDGYHPDNLRILEQNYKLIVANTNTIDYIGGGSVRCMTAEIF